MFDGMKYGYNILHSNKVILICQNLLDSHFLYLCLLMASLHYSKIILKPRYRLLKINIYTLIYTNLGFQSLQAGGVL